MNHIRKAFGICALAAVIMTGCASSETDKTIDDLESVTEDAAAAMATTTREEAKTSPKFKELEARAGEVEVRMKKHEAEFTPEQKERITKILTAAQANGAKWQ